MTALNWKLLTAFEAAARHRNFTHAAGELNVQQPAISRRVAELEAELGVELLERTRPKATLTGEGEVLFRAVSESVHQVRSAIEHIRARPDSKVVTVNTTIGFASCYLMQRLSGFRAQNPEISVELVSRDQNDAYGLNQADIVIVFDEPDRLPGIRQARIFSETLVAVARPGFASHIGDDIAALANLPLLHLSKGIHFDDWKTFFAGTGILPPAPRSDQRFTSFMVCLQAALNGEGVMLGWETLMQSHFDLGQLVRLTTHRVETGRGYFACLTERASGAPGALQLWQWLAALEKCDGNASSSSVPRQR